MIKLINLGSGPGLGDGHPARTGGQIINDNFAQLSLIIEQLVLEVAITPYTSFKFLHKGFGNTDLNANEIGDIFCGWSNDGTIRISEAKWLGGSLTDSDNFSPIVQTEI